MEANQKAQELINQYYGYTKSQKEAIQAVDEVLLTRLCQDIDNLHGHHVIKKDYDEALVISAINSLKYWQEVAVEVKNISNKMPV